ncbi:SMC-Scp complex subunit ScpB [Pelagibacterium luteolum]|uniref:Segregation and condensation protein B n=1 Tax=Pelagibacterium luteolum TaxID=440168 RepID=A0A1G7W0F0_9HYPH|nr:SMC-Scp complex subunit ScpB [Pelagibacterium luteolum]SDG65139.1 segregation and condensation protein B [Pelagibacterium luteolum]
MSAYEEFGEQPEIEARNLRIMEALLFASEEPVDLEAMRPYLSDGADLDALIDALQRQYAGRGVTLVQRGSKWAFRTAEDLNFLLRREQTDTRPLSRAALETLAIIAYHQPSTRAEIEEVRGVSISKGTLDVLMEAGWVRMRGRRRTPGRPVTYGTTDAFLDHFGLEALSDLPGLEDLKGAGLLSSRVPSSFQVPLPFAGDLTDEEDPLDPDDLGDPESDDESND